MAHYAFINENNEVVEVITGRDESEVVGGISDWEAYYQSLRSGLRCLRTSYNTFGGVHKTGGIPFRKNYAGIGYTYDEQRDAFIPPKPDPLFFSVTDKETGETKNYQWVLNEESCLWDAVVLE